MDSLGLIIVFCLAGFFLKTADFLGEKGFKVKAFLASGLSALLFWVLLKANSETATLILSITVGCVLALKVDRPNLVFGVGFLAFLAFIFGFCLPIFWLLVLLTAVTVLDEFTHEKLKNMFFRFRGFLKTVVVILAFLGFLSYLNALGFIIFDLTYDLTDVWLKRVKS
jgi:hypothetical protein